MAAKEATAGINVVDRKDPRRDAASHEPSSEELARRAQRGCRASFAELVRRYAPRLQAFLCQRTSDYHDAEDLVQETFVKAYQNIERYRPSYKFSTWLFTIATRLAVSHGRKMRARLRLIRPARHRSRWAEPAGPRERHEDLWLLARRLTENQYRVLWLKYGQEMSIKEIAQIMHRSQVSVKVLLYRARISLLNKWNAEYGEEGNANTQDEKRGVSTDREVQ